MKKRSLVCLALCALLCSCQAQTNPTPPNNDTASLPDAEANARIEYYEQLVNELQKEILSLRTEIYVGRVQYEALMEDLLASVPFDTPSNGEQDGSDTASEAQFFYTVEDGKATLTAYVGKETQVTLPSEIDGYRVVAVGDRAFMNRTDVVSVIVPTGVQTLGWFAFSGCIALTSVELPDTVERIAYGAFDNCPTSLTLCCSPTSYAAAYAQSYGLTAKEVT